MATKEFKIDIDYDELTMTAINLVSDLDNILKEYGIRLEIENEEHDGYDVCVVKIEEDE
jgi:sugar phosphate isomerase/epimerase